MADKQRGFAGFGTGIRLLSLCFLEIRYTDLIIKLLWKINVAFLGQSS